MLKFILWLPSCSPSVYLGGCCLSASGRIPFRTLLGCCKKLVHCRQAGYRTVVLGISKMLAHLEKKCDSSRHPFRDGSWVLQNFVHCSCQEEPEVLQLVWIRGFPFLCSVHACGVTLWFAFSSSLIHNASFLCLALSSTMLRQNVSTAGCKYGILLLVQKLVEFLGIPF